MLQEYKTILVPIDQSVEAERAFKKAVNVAKRNGARLVIAHVVEGRAFQAPNGYLDSDFTDDALRYAHVLLEKYGAIAKEFGITEVTTCLEFGAPKKMIAHDLVARFAADLIMIGATGLNTVERLLLGSVSEYVTLHATCDVMVVRTDLNNIPQLQTTD